MFKPIIKQMMMMKKSTSIQSFRNKNITSCGEYLSGPSDYVSYETFFHRLHKRISWAYGPSRDSSN
jgi:hypothetical protein